jgi:RNA processing factor Prp31
LTEEVATTVREAALYSMGTDITAADLQQIQECCTKLIDHAQEYHPTD